MNSSSEVGIVRSVKNFLLKVDGLPSIKINDIVESESGAAGYVFSLYNDYVEVLLLDTKDIKPNEEFKNKQSTLSVPVGNFLLGRAINPLGIPIDGGTPLAKTRLDKYALPLDQPALGVEYRDLIAEQMVTGFTVVDMLIPIGKGQRELILADPRSGKLNFLIDLIINQKNTDIVCVVASIGKPLSELKNLINTLNSNGALKNTIIVAGTSSDTPPLTFLTPMAAFSVAEYFQRSGKDVLLILDDLVNHAKVYREISLLSDRFPSRESYPGDIFNVHAKLLERAGKFNKKGGGKSITALPVAEINLNDFTSFIPTNLMSMTDGHLLFRSALYLKNQRPAIDIPLSVSRVGKQTQTKIQNQIGTKVNQVLAKASESENISSFEFELPDETRTVLKQKSLIQSILVQPSLTTIPAGLQVALLGLAFTKFMLDKDVAFLEANREKIIKILLSKDYASFTSTILKIKEETELINKLDQILQRSLR